MADTIVLNQPANVRIYMTGTSTKSYKEGNPNRVYPDNKMLVGFNTATWTKNGVSMGYGMSSSIGDTHGFRAGIQRLPELRDTNKRLLYGYSYIGYVDKNANASMVNYNAYKKKLVDINCFDYLSSYQCDWSSKEVTYELFPIYVPDVKGILAIGDVYYAHLAAAYLDEYGNETYSSWANSSGFTIKSTYSVYFSANGITLTKGTYTDSPTPDPLPSSRTVTYSDEDNWWGVQLRTNNIVRGYQNFCTTYSGVTKENDFYMKLSLSNATYRNLNTSPRYYSLCDFSSEYNIKNTAYYGDVTFYLNTEKQFNNVLYKKTKTATETQTYDFPSIDTENGNKILEGYYDASNDKQIYPKYESYFTGTLYPKYFNENVTVTINPCEGSVSANKFIFGKGKAISLQPYGKITYYSERAGYVNKGLYHDPEFTIPFDVTKPLNEDTVLYIKWEPNTSECKYVTSDEVNICIDDKTTTARPYIYSKGKWRQAIPQICIDDSWRTMQQNCEWDLADYNYGSFRFDGFKDSLDKGYVKSSFSLGDDILFNKIKGQILSGYYDEPAILKILGFDHNKELEGDKTVHLRVCSKSRRNGLNTAIHHIDGGGNLIGVDNRIFGIQSIMNLTSTAAGGWKDSYMRNTICPQFYNIITDPLKSIIVKCPKYSDNNPVVPMSADNVTLTEDYIWILSLPEIGLYGYSDWEISYYGGLVNPGEKEKQKQYDFFKNGGDPALLVHYSDNIIDNNLEGYSLRSPAYTSTSIDPKAFMEFIGYNNDFISYGIASSFSPCLVVKYN